MFNFRFFPGVDFTKINLDWIMRKIGLLEAGQKTAEEAAEQATAAAEQATAAAEDATEAVEAVVGTANEAKQIAQNALTHLYSKFPVSVANGGTGASNIIDAQTNLGLSFDSNSGYCKMPDGTLIQYGEATIAANTKRANIIFPQTFADTSYGFAPTHAYTTKADIILSYSYKTRSSIAVYDVEALSEDQPFSWLAIGRWK